MRLPLPLLFASVATMTASLGGAAEIAIDPSQGQSRISPYIYGANQVDGSSVQFTSRRLGGNRLTGYNWENNCSNAGSDWQHSSDMYLCSTAASCSAPGATMTQFVDAANAAGAYPLVTLQMAGYASADDQGTVDVADAAPSSRWVQVLSRKGSSFVTKPDLTDGKVFMDELVNFLVQRYGLAKDGGVLGYSLDNEPDLWASTHPRIHPTACGAAELVERSAELAAAVKSVDPQAEIFGFVSYGYAGYVGLQDAADWKSVQGDFEWYVQSFLSEMATASAKAGMRLLDVLDLHYYSEARGGDTRVQEGTTANAAARVQSTRSLWDPNYGYSTTDPTVGENSWITQWNDPIQLIPRVKRYIKELYPDTKFALTEYDFGAANHVSGGIAQADALGIFGSEGLHFATRWGDPGTYTDAAYQLYLDYDGNGSRFGDIHVKTTSSDVVNVPAYAALDASDSRKLHVILINRSLTAAQTAAVAIAGATAFTTARAFGFDADSAKITDRGTVPVTNNSFSMQLPPLSASHVVLSGTETTPIVGVGGSSGTVSGAEGGSIIRSSSGVGGDGATPGSVTPTKRDESGCDCRLVVERQCDGIFLFVAALWMIGARKRQHPITRVNAGGVGTQSRG